MKILIIDDANKTLAPIHSALKSRQCQLAYTKDPVLGLKTLNKHKFDAIVSAKEIARTSSENLIKAVALKFPELVRCALISDADSQSEIVQQLHLNFTPDYDHQAVVNNVLDLIAQKKKVANQHIVKMVAKVKTLPSPPKVFLQLNMLLQQRNVDSDRIAQIITQDPALAAKVLQYANNTFVPNGKPLTDITDAITKIGVEALTCIVMTAELFSQDIHISNFSIINEQIHALAVARFAATLVSTELKHMAMLSGLLHSIGKLVLYQTDERKCQQFLLESSGIKDVTELEQKYFSATHCQVGAYLLHSWNFSKPIIEAVLIHKQPKQLLQRSFGINQAVYLANTLLNEMKVEQSFVEHFKLEESLDKLSNKVQLFK